MDENTYWLIIGGTIGAIIGALFGGIIQGWITDYNNMKILHIQQNNEVKTLAVEFLNDLNFIETAESNFEDFIYNPQSDYNNLNSPRYHATIAWQDPIYPTWGMYYSNRQDISKFYPELSKELILFYGLVLTAESEREQYNNYDKLFPRDEKDNFLEENRKQNLIRIFNNMKGNINKSRPMIAQLRIKLEKISNSLS